MKTVTMMKNDLMEKRVLYISILKEMFESEFPKHFSATKVSPVIEEAVRYSEKVLELNINSVSPNPDKQNFTFVDSLRDYAFRKQFFIFSKQVKHLEVDLEEFIDDLTFHRIPNDEEIVNEVVEGSKALLNFVDDIKKMGIETSISQRTTGYSSVTLNLSWN